MSQIETLVAFVKSQVGYKETPVNRTKYAEKIDALRKEGKFMYNYPKQGVAWCDVFVDASFLECFGFEEAQRMLCQPDYSAGAGCKFSAQYYRNAGRWYDSPEVGDQIFFGPPYDENHTGIVVKVDDKKVYTVEGNSDDEVKAHQYALSNKKISGYGRPRYSDEETKPSEPVDTKPVDAKPVDTKPVADDVYVVKKGDTLSRIARQHGTTVNELVALNGLSNPNLIRVGQKIKLPSSHNDVSGSDVFVGKVNTEKLPLNVRKGPGMQYPVVATLRKGAAVELYTKAVDGWYRLANGAGYVKSSFII